MRLGMAVCCFTFFIFSAFSQNQEIKREVDKQSKRAREEATTKTQPPSQKHNKKSVKATQEARPEREVLIRGIVGARDGAKIFDVERKQVRDLRSVLSEDVLSEDTKSNKRPDIYFAIPKDDYLWLLELAEGTWTVKGFQGNRFKDGRKYEMSSPVKHIKLAQTFSNPMGFYVLKNDPVTFFVLVDRGIGYLYEAESGRKVKFPARRSFIKAIGSNTSPTLLFEHLDGEPKYYYLSLSGGDIAPVLGTVLKRDLTHGPFELHRYAKNKFFDQIISWTPAAEGYLQVLITYEGKVLWVDHELLHKTGLVARDLSQTPPLFDQPPAEQVQTFYWQNRPLIRVGEKYYYLRSAEEEQTTAQPVFTSSLTGDVCLMQNIDGNILLGNETTIERRHHRTFVLMGTYTVPSNFQWCLTHSL